ncbi:hypothetical protein ABC502_14570 [Alkalimonas sp. NCh-2]|uniref:hypothetical protein n=1 Tax=Alkalimonas sp. NCh-2 TaxID=3144846 RepID=UPI0031F71A6F
MNKQSKSDRDLLHAAGFFDTYLTATGDVKQRVDHKRLAEFCCVSLRTVRSWSQNGLPKRVRKQLESLHKGSYLPDSWRRAGIRVVHDGVELKDGVHINLDTLQFWTFIVCGVDWGRVLDIQESLNRFRATGRLPVVLDQGQHTARQMISSVSECARLE